MSLVTIINKIEHERSLNQTLLTSLLDGLDAEIKRIEERKTDLIQEFAERDASLMRIIEGDARLGDPVPLPVKDAEAA